MVSELTHLVPHVIFRIPHLTESEMKDSFEEIALTITSPQSYGTNEQGKQIREFSAPAFPCSHKIE
jgi:hypothetical protein